MQTFSRWYNFVEKILQKNEEKLFIEIFNTH